MGFLYKGKEIPGLDRTAGHFMDGIFIRKVLVTNRIIRVYDQFDNVLYTEAQPLPTGFVTKSIGCIRSAQTGKLIVVIGGFNEGSSSQCAHVMATDYFIKPPAVYQG